MYCIKDYHLDLQALTLEMTPPDYAWITFGWFSEDFWTKNFTNRTDYNAFDHCSQAEMRKIVNKIMFVDQYPRHDEGDDDIIIGDLVNKWIISVLI